MNQLREEKENLCVIIGDQLREVGMLRNREDETKEDMEEQVAQEKAAMREQFQLEIERLQHEMEVQKQRVSHRVHPSVYFRLGILSLTKLNTYMQVRKQLPLHYIHTVPCHGHFHC